MIGYEAAKFVHLLSRMPRAEVSSLCKAAGCSWDEAFSLADRGLITLWAEEEKHRILAAINGNGLSFCTQNPEPDYECDLPEIPA